MGNFERSQLIACTRVLRWQSVSRGRAPGVPRNTLRYRLEKHGLRPDTSPSTVGKTPRRTESGAAAGRSLSSWRSWPLPSPAVPIAGRRSPQRRPEQGSRVRWSAGGDRRHSRRGRLSIRAGGEGKPSGPHRLAIQRAFSQTAAPCPLRRTSHPCDRSVGQNRGGRRATPSGRSGGRRRVMDRLAARSPRTPCCEPGRCPFVTGQLGAFRAGRWR